MKELRIIDEVLIDANSIINSAEYVLIKSCYVEGQDISSTNRNILYHDCYFDNSNLLVADSSQAVGCVFAGGTLKQLKRHPSHYQPVTNPKYA